MIRELDDQASRNAQDFEARGSARYGKPENIADVVAFLASDGAAHVNGAAWVVDDGMTAGDQRSAAPIFSDTIFAALRSSVAMVAASPAGILSCRTSGTVRAATARPDASTIGQL